MKKLTKRDIGLIQSGYMEGFAHAQAQYQRETQRITELYRKLKNKMPHICKPNYEKCLRREKL
jgi:hypothetical protein